MDKAGALPTDAISGEVGIWAWTLSKRAWGVGMVTLACLF